MLKYTGRDGTRVKLSVDLLHGRAMSRMGVPNGIALKDARGKIVGGRITRNFKGYYNVLWDDSTQPTELGENLLDDA